MRALVCGGRDFDDWEALRDVLDLFPGITTIIEGGAKGADALARHYVEMTDGVMGRATGNGFTYRRLTCETYKADWEKHGNAAGPIRNQRMLDEGKPNIVIAFPGGRGTADMVRRAIAHPVLVLVVKPVKR